MAVTATATLIATKTHTIVTETGVVNLLNFVEHQPVGDDVKQLSQELLDVCEPQLHLNPTCKLRLLVE